MDIEENFILCRLCGIVKMQTFVEIAEHEKNCRCFMAREGKKKKMKIIKATNKKCSLISDHFCSSDESQLQKRKRVQIGNEIYFLQNDISDGPTVSLSDYSISQQFKFQVLFSADLYQFQCWADIEKTDNFIIDCHFTEAIQFYSDQLQTGNISLKSGDVAIKRIMRYNPLYLPPESWRSTKLKVENLLSNFRLLSHEFLFPEEWGLPNTIPLVTIEVRDILDIVACILADPKLQNSGEFKLNTYKATGKRGEKGACDHIMSSPWAIKSKVEIDRTDPEGILIPIILYEDGITVDSAGVRNVDSIVLTLGNYSKNARNRDISKFHLGFVPKIRKSSEIKNLLQAKFGKSKGLNTFKLFRQQIYRDIYRLVLSTVNQVSSQGQNSFLT